MTENKKSLKAKRSAEAKERRKIASQNRKQKKEYKEYSKNNVTNEDVISLASQIKSMQKDFIAEPINDEVDLVLETIRNEDDELFIDEEIDISEETPLPVNIRKPVKEPSVPVNLKDLNQQPRKQQYIKPQPINILLGNSKENPFEVKSNYNEVYNYLNYLFGTQDGSYFLISENRSVRNKNLKCLFIEDKNNFKYNIWIDTGNVLLCY
jgi:hypothetical protein